MKLYLIRHGITSWNKQKRYCGYRDIALSSEGRKQAMRLRNMLKSNEFDVIYLSDRKRALQTAKIIFNGRKIIKAKELKEINFGALEGLTHKQILEIYPKKYRNWLKDPFRHSIPKSESLSAFKKRVCRTMNKISRLHLDKTIAVICHGGTISVLINELLKTGNFWQNIPSAASVTIIEYKKAKPKIIVFNETKHLSQRKS